MSNEMFMFVTLMSLVVVYGGAGIILGLYAKKHKAE